MKDSILRAVLCLLAILILFGVNAVARDSYTLGCFAFEGDETQDAMMMKITRDIAKIMPDELGIKLTVKWYHSEKELRDAVDSEELDFVFSSSGHYLELFGDDKYEPFLGVSILGIKKKANCIYVRKDSPYKNVKDLKNKKIVTYGDYFDYMELRKLVHGEPPEFYFERLDTVANGMSSFYALSMNEVQAAFVSNSTYKFLKVTNPGPVANIREMTCSIGWYDTPIFISTKVPENKAKKILKIFQSSFDTAEKHESLKKYAPLLKAYKIKFVPLGADDFQPFYDLYREGQKKGWEIDYERWWKYAASE